MKQKKLQKDWPVLPIARWDRDGLLEWREKHRPEINEVRKRQLLLKHHLGRDVMI